MSCLSFSLRKKDVISLALGETLSRYRDFRQQYSCAFPPPAPPERIRDKLSRGGYDISSILILTTAN